jgi:hypothetical protein
MSPRPRACATSRQRRPWLPGLAERRGVDRSKSSASANAKLAEDRSLASSATRGDQTLTSADGSGWKRLDTEQNGAHG